jgi:hypothetical protein
VFFWPSGDTALLPKCVMDLKACKDEPFLFPSACSLSDPHLEVRAADRSLPGAVNGIEAGGLKLWEAGCTAGCFAGSNATPSLCMLTSASPKPPPRNTTDAASVLGGDGIPQAAPCPWKGLYCPLQISYKGKAMEFKV